jgi:uncharacterized RDD family membrane protein YckC
MAGAAEPAARTAAVPPKPAGATVPTLKRRLAAMLYESLLLCGVVFGASFALLAPLGWRFPLDAYRTTVLQAVVFVIMGAYFVVCWRATGQTLATRTWRLRVVDRAGRPLTTGRAVVRYLSGWAVLVVPGLLLVALFRTHDARDLLLLALPLVAATIAARADPEGQWLHDRLAGSRVVAVPA